MFSDEEIVDELIDFLTAATITTRNAVVSLINHLANRPDVRAKIRTVLDERYNLIGSCEE